MWIYERWVLPLVAGPTPVATTQQKAARSH